jgi:hypothetical protein
MDIAVQDRVRYRKMRHAVRMTADLRAADAIAETCLGDKLNAAAVALLEAAVAAYRPEDDATLAVRASEQHVRNTLTAVGKALRRAGAAADEDTADAMDALLEAVFPNGRVAEVPAGPQLLRACERLTAALRESQPELASSLEALGAQYGEAIDAANATVEEIDPNALKLVKARADADRWIRASRAFVTYKVESDPTCGVAFDDVWPVGEVGSADAQNAALDDCGVPEPEDEQAVDEEPLDDEQEG